jgi:hypothetical protein
MRSNISDLRSFLVFVDVLCFQLWMRDHVVVSPFGGVHYTAIGVLVQVVVIVVIVIKVFGLVCMGRVSPNVSTRYN